MTLKEISSLEPDELSAAIERLTPDELNTVIEQILGVVDDDDYGNDGVPDWARNPAAAHDLRADQRWMYLPRHELERAVQARTPEAICRAFVLAAIFAKHNAPLTPSMDEFVSYVPNASIPRPWLHMPEDEKREWRTGRYRYLPLDP